MSVAFVREESAEFAQEVELPPRPLSPHPNLVTTAGLAALQRGQLEARQAIEAGRQLDDPLERRRAAAHAQRDLEYFHERLLTAELQRDPTSHETVSFGAKVTIKRDGARTLTYRIVGEDEAEPREGSISYIAPLAHALMGKRVGDFVELDGHEVEVLAIE